MYSISVIIPVFNCEEYISRSIESVLNQTFPDFELILVDDGSQDKSGTICDSYARIDNRIQVIHKENGGVSSARNAGLSAASGDYVCFLDGDDYFEKGFLSEICKGNYDLVLTGFVLENEKGDIILRRKVKDETIKTRDKAYIKNCFIDGLLNYACTKRFKRSIIENNQLRFTEQVSVGEDTLFVLEYVENAESICSRDYQGYHYVKYDHITLTNPPSLISKISSIETLNDFVFAQLKRMYGEQAKQITTSRLVKIYKNILVQMVNDETCRKEEIYYLFKQYWFRQVLGDETIVGDENWKYRMVVRCRSGFLFWNYLKFRRLVLKKGNGHANNKRA